MAARSNWLDAPPTRWAAPPLLAIRLPDRADSHCISASGRFGEIEDSLTKTDCALTTHLNNQAHLTDLLRRNSSSSSSPHSPERCEPDQSIELPSCPCCNEDLEEWPGPTP